MRIREEMPEEEGLNLIPMIDVLSVLLVFFLVATTFVREERDLHVQLPGTSAQPLSAPSPEFIINIREDGTTVVNNEVCEAAKLAAMVTDATKNEPGRPILIRADERSLVRHFARIASLCRQAGVSEVKIGYVLEPGN